MLVSVGENYEIQLYELKENSAFEMEESPTITFFGKPAGRLDRKNYRIQQGIASNNDSIYLMSSNLPAQIKANDKVKFLGKMWIVQSVGYFFDSALVVNARIFSPEFIMSKCVKGITLGAL